MLSEAQFYRDEAQRCEARLARVRDPRCRQRIEMERRDWSDLAERRAHREPEPRTLADIDPGA